jgi:hypothetical protein
LDLTTPVFGIRVPRYWLRMRWGDPIPFTVSPITGVTYGTGGDLGGSDSPFPSAAVQRRTGSPVYFMFNPKAPGGPAPSLVEGDAVFEGGIVSAFWMSAPRRAICPRTRRVKAAHPVA